MLDTCWVLALTICMGGSIPSWWSFTSLIHFTSTVRGMFCVAMHVLDTANGYGINAKSGTNEVILDGSSFISG